MNLKTLALLGLLPIVGMAQTRKETMLTDAWLFSHDGAQWEQVRIPHDWAISGPFDKEIDKQTVRIEQNGEKEATEKTGRSGALPWIGKGQYKTTFKVPAGSTKAEVLFDGAMSEPVVFVNGKEAGHWAYGYNSFHLDITPFVDFSKENELLVRLQNVEESSRWYPGAGLYRPVKLIFTGDTRIKTWSTYLRTLHVKGDTAVIAFETQVEKPTRDTKVAVAFEGTTMPATMFEVDADGKACGILKVSNPLLWTPESPYLYPVRITVRDGKRSVDDLCMKYGIRTVAVNAEHGFMLNGVSRKLKGVCLHHDLGPLGAAINRAALIRQIRILKDMGCDAIRTAHNMPSQWQMEICDSMGMMVMAESFDMWIYPKCRNGYARFFKEWADLDIENLVLAHRNHPCIVMWSIGNEIPEQSSKQGVQIACHLQDICHRLDPSRPVTQGMDRADAALKSGFAQVMDVPGFNYRVHKYDSSLPKLPQAFLLGSETASTVSSRGVYKFPVERSAKKKYDDGQCSSYDVEYCSWSNLPEDDWVYQDDKSWVIGEFVWTGFDYLGEPTPYDEYWPSRSSYFGICDLAGLPKDRFWLYRSRWNTQENTLHLVPHWSFGKEREGKVTPVYCYTNHPTAELFVNGKSQGKRTKNPAEKWDRYRLRWNEVLYEPGELKVVAYDRRGMAVDSQTVYTAGKPARLRMESDRTILQADEDDMAFVTVSVVDNEGNLCPDADNQLTFQVSGAGRFQAACNGDATSLEPFTLPTMKAFHGQLVVLVRSSRQPGDITLTVKDAKQKKIAATMTIRSK